MKGSVEPIPPAYATYLVDLPLCSLHVMEAGHGPPLIIVPATISELDNWKELIQFMAQWFRVYFFELPGHGLSTAFAAEFTSDKVAETIGHLAERIGADRFNLMGFSFGGVLAMKTFIRLQEQIDQMILIAPCITREALLLSIWQQRAANLLNRLLKNAGVRSFLAGLMRDKLSRRVMARFLHLLGRVEHPGLLEAKLGRMPPAVIEVVSHELDEILTASFPHPAVKYSTPCYFAMSVRDPSLDHKTTLDELRQHFENINSTELYFPFHQPPKPFTFEELNRDFGPTVEAFLARA